MWELNDMLEKAIPLNWTFVKWLTVLCVCVVWVGVSYKKKHRVHAWIQRFAYAGLLGLFIWGAIHRGIWGSLVHVQHSDLYKAFAYTHVGLGGIYIILGFIALFSGPCILARRSFLGLQGRRLLMAHRGIGITASIVITFSVGLLIFM